MNHSSQLSHHSSGMNIVDGGVRLGAGAVTDKSVYFTGTQYSKVHIHTWIQYNHTEKVENCLKISTCLLIILLSDQETVLVSSFILTWMSMCPTIALSCQTWMSELDASSLNVQFKTIEIYQNKSTFCFLFLIFQDLLSQIYNTFLWLSVSGQIKYLLELSSICNLSLWMYNFIILGKLPWSMIIL